MGAGRKEGGKEEGGKEESVSLTGNLAPDAQRQSVLGREREGERNGGGAEAVGFAPGNLGGIFSS